jgi:hypothetical protein
MSVPLKESVVKKYALWNILGKDATDKVDSLGKPLKVITDFVDYFWYFLGTTLLLMPNLALSILLYVMSIVKIKKHCYIYFEPRVKGALNRLPACLRQHCYTDFEQWEIVDFAKLMTESFSVYARYVLKLYGSSVLEGCRKRMVSVACMSESMTQTPCYYRLIVAIIVRVSPTPNFGMVDENRDHTFLDVVGNEIMGFAYYIHTKCDEIGDYAVFQHLVNFLVQHFPDIGITCEEENAEVRLVQQPDCVPIRKDAMYCVLNTCPKSAGEIITKRSEQIIRIIALLIRNDQPVSYFCPIRMQQVTRPVTYTRRFNPGGLELLRNAKNSFIRSKNARS